MRQQHFERYSHFYEDNDGAGFRQWWEGLTPDERRELVGALADPALNMEDGGARCS